MLTFIFQQLAFYFTILIVLFLPGYLVLRAYQGKNRIFSKIETPVFSLVFSIAAVDFLMLLLGKLSIGITRFSLLSALLLFCLAALWIFKLRVQKQKHVSSITEPIFSRKQILIILGLIFATVFLKTIYLQNAVLPTATDLGHHMYWTNTIVQTGHLPVYEKMDITPGTNTLAAIPIADFIIGEHLPFAAIALISGLSVVSAFPVLMLFLIHLAALAALFVLALELFKNSAERQNIAVLVLFFAGPLYAISSPQMKFVSGGVIGNTIGNLLIPVAIYFFLRALQEKRSSFLSLAIFVGLTMAYTHHLSTLVFIFIALFSGLYFVFNNLEDKFLFNEIKNWLRLIFHPLIWAILLFAAFFVFVVYMPTYLNVKAVGTAMGAPSKATRIGFTFTDLAQNAGDIRFALALAGIILLIFSAKRRSYQAAFTIGWTISLLLMSTRPQWLFINIPSNRVASYFVFPAILMSSYAAATGLAFLQNSSRKQLALQPVFLLGIFFLFMAFALQGGEHDNAIFIGAANSDKQKIVETYAAAQYLANTTNEKDVILKDHNYLAADSWIKVFLMRGYNYPLSRGYFKRYEDETKQREMCTYHMLTTPSSPEAKACFAGTGTDILMVNPQFDSAQLRKDRSFWQVYVSNNASIYYKNN